MLLFLAFRTLQSGFLLSHLKFPDRLELVLDHQGAFNHFFQWYYDTALVFVRVTPGIALRCVAISVPLGILAGLVASWALLRRDIMALIRR